MESMMQLTSQNPLSLLVKFGMMAWNGTCADNCSGHGECHNGTCLCEIQFDGLECHTPNMSYYIAFATIFFIMALVCLIQLVMCIVAEWQRMKAPSFLRACRLTTQKLLYFVVFLASLIRGAYFTSPAAFREGWSSSLMSAYYPLLLSGSSLVVCFWAEVFHLRDVRWEKPQFLSKSRLAFVTFNIITYSLLLAEFIATSLAEPSDERRSFYTHIFNGCYAVLLFIVVIFFLIYGVEVFFKVRGGFLCDSSISSIGPSRRSPADAGSHEEASALCPGAGPSAGPSASASAEPAPRDVDPSQLSQSRLGLLSQALMLLVVVAFLCSETLSEFWKTKVPLVSRNWHDVVFRVVEIGVVLWFPCVLWNCMSPEQLWILNPKRILKRLEPPTPPPAAGPSSGAEGEGAAEPATGADCWICYDAERVDAGPLIQPCACRGDVSSVHHDCLRRWLVESSECAGAEASLSCKVCATPYNVQRGARLDWQHGFTAQHWLKTCAIVTVMCVSAAAAWVVIQLFADPVVRMTAAGAALLVQYVCVRFLGLNTVVAYHRAKVSALSIVGGEQKALVSTISQAVAVDMPKAAPAHI